jgi:cell wall-associated NlpC family hydrolase
VAVLLVLPGVIAVAAPSSAITAKEKYERAKEKLAELQQEFAVRVTRLNEASDRLQQAQTQLAATKARMDAAAAEADAARTRLSDRAVQAYTEMGTQLDVLLQAQSFSEFSDRLTFMGAIAQSDADLAAAADAASQRAEWAAEDYANAVAQARVHVQEMQSAKIAIQEAVTEQRQVATDLGEEYRRILAAQEQAQADAEPGLGYGAPPPLPPPPPNTSKAAIAVNAARSVIGAPYVWGAAGPSAFDCSGLTLWAWGRAGVRLPHSAYEQFTNYPQVPLSQVRLGDLIYYGNYGPHIAIYIGSGLIIHARHPGPGGEVQVSSMYGYDRPWGASRPGT